MTEHIPLQENSKYRIGAVTYEVTTFFHAEGSKLQDKISRLLLAEIRQIPNHTFARPEDNVVK